MVTPYYNGSEIYNFVNHSLLINARGYKRRFLKKYKEVQQFQSFYRNISSPGLGIVGS